MLNICNKNHNLNETQHKGASQVSEGVWVCGTEDTVCFLNLIAVNVKILNVI